MGRLTRDPINWLSDEDDDESEGATVVMTGSFPPEAEGLFEDDEPSSEDASPTVMMDASSAAELEEGTFPSFSLAPDFGLRPDQDEGATEIRHEDQDRTVVITDPGLPVVEARPASDPAAGEGAAFGAMALVGAALVAAVAGALLALFAVGLVWWW